MRRKDCVVCPDVFPQAGAGGALFHLMTYYEFGEPNDWTDPVVCVHGLTRNGRDFERLGNALAKDGRYVICPNVVGRGDSDILATSAYSYEQYVSDMVVLLRHLAAKTGKADPFTPVRGYDEPLVVDWVGTSMGGIIGMKLAAQHPDVIRKMVLNDVGPVVSNESLNQIASYVGQTHFFSNRDDARAYVRDIYAKPFGLVGDDDINYLTDISIRALPSGGYTLAYDPRIGYSFAYQRQCGGFQEDYDIWETWRKVRCRVLILRGAESYLLTGDVVEQMKLDPPPREGDGVRVSSVEFAGCGHAPSLMVPDQIEVVTSYITSR